MKLTKLLIYNFRSIGGDELNPGVVIDFDNVNVINLIGQNNAGKSSILYAYDYFVTSGKTVTNSDFHKNGDAPIIIEAWLKAETSEEAELPALKNWVSKDKTEKELYNVAKYRKVWTKGNKNGEKYTYSFENQQWVKGGAGGFDQHLQKACPTPIWLRGLDSVEIILENVQKLIKEQVLNRATEFKRYKIIEEQLKELRKEIIDDEYSQKIQSRLTELMQETFPELEVSLFGNEKDNLGKKLPNFIDTEINFSSNEQSYAVHMDNHGHGVRRQFLFNSIRGLNDVFNEISKAKAKRDQDLIAGLSFDQTSNKSKMLLIEEPELFLHPQSVRMFSSVLYDLVENPNFQIISATHSPVMIDLSRDHTTLIRTEIKNGETSVYQVKDNIFDKDEKEQIKMLNNFNPYVCEAFFADHVVLVEGDTEAIVYREVLKNMVEEDIVGIQNVPLIVNCGSKMNIPAFQKVLRHFNIPYFVIHDLDYTYKSNGHKNAAWTLNERIYEEIMEHNKEGKIKAKRYIMDRNFESQHNYEHTSSLGKPLSAHRLAASWDVKNESIPGIEAIRMCLGLTEQKIFDQEWVELKRTEKVVN
ncbi:AAA family ATPase [Aciduricibacillus chroicocephali]|uniref:AAA family ATPase n=1 Tax=Aciduricibacillus chroicocephali TaxID=3054939 RepID=A0ABY9KWB5_9BACI|nr:AAA family ATPase [Bacillaceae bacterium 44XB]